MRVCVRASVRMWVVGVWVWVCGCGVCGVVCVMPSVMWCVWWLWMVWCDVMWCGVVWCGLTWCHDITRIWSCPPVLIFTFLFRGDLIISGGTDRKVCVWDLEQCTLLLSVDTDLLLGPHCPPSSEKTYVIYFLCGFCVFVFVFVFVFCMCVLVCVRSCAIVCAQHYHIVTRNSRTYKNWPLLATSWPISLTHSFCAACSPCTLPCQFDDISHHKRWPTWHRSKNHHKGFFFLIFLL